MNEEERERKELVADPRFTETLVVWFPRVALSSLVVEQRTLMDPELGFWVREADLQGKREEVREEIHGEALRRKGRM